MWTVKTFKTREAYERFIAANEHRIQWQAIFVNNVPYAIEYRSLRSIRMPR